MIGFGKKKNQSSWPGIRCYSDAIAKLGYKVGDPCGFVPGCAYVANSTPAFPAKQIVVVACGRDSGGGMTFVRVGDMATGSVNAIEGRECVNLRFNDGVKYFVSSAVPADVDEASRVIGMIRGK